MEKSLYWKIFRFTDQYQLSSRMNHRQKEMPEIWFEPMMFDPLPIRHKFILQFNDFFDQWLGSHSKNVQVVFCSSFINFISCISSSLLLRRLICYWLLETSFYNWWFPISSCWYLTNLRTLNEHPAHTYWWIEIY